MKKSMGIKPHHPKQQKLGTYFTPYYVADWISSMTLKLFFEHQNHSEIKIYDPTIGKGVFLSAIIDNLTYSEKGQTKILKNINNIQLFGTDLQQDFVESSYKSLSKLISKKKKNSTLFIKPKIDIANGLTTLLKSTNDFDIIIGNPPYIRQESLSEELKSEMVSVLSNIYPNLARNFSKQADYYLYFILLGFNALKRNGILAFIVSTSWMNTKFGKSFRKFLLKLPARITLAFSSNKRLIPNVKINTMVIFLERRKSKQNGLFNVSKIYISEDNKIQITSTKQISRNLLENIPNWETFLFRLPQQFFEINKLFSKYLIPLNQVAELKTGIYTGLNDFFYVLKKNDMEKNHPRPNTKYLFPIIRNTKEIKSWVITIDDLSHYLFICRNTKENLKKSDPQTYNYLLWGQNQTTHTKQKVIEKIPWPSVPSIRKRSPGWWSFPEVKPTQVFLRYIYYRNYLQPYSQEPTLSDRCFHQVYPFESINPQKLSIILNFVVTQLYIEVYGRSTLGQGALKFETMSARNLPILNCLNLPFWDLFSPIKFSQLENLEITAYKSLGIPNPKEIYNQIKSIHKDLVENRINKSTNT